MEESEKTEVEIDLARKKYTPAATRGSIIYFVIADLSGIDPMYQYSLQYYQSLFDRCGKSVWEMDGGGGGGGSGGCGGSGGGGCGGCGGGSLPWALR